MAATGPSVVTDFSVKILRADKKRYLACIVTVVCGLAFMGIFSLAVPNPGLFHPDSYSYIDFALSRTAGYPLFLAIVAHFDPSYEALPFVQMMILVFSVALMVEACYRIHPAAIAWSLAGCIILMNPFLWRYTGMILTESLYTSACVLFVGCIMMAVENRPRGAYWLLGSGLLVGIAISIRPVGYGLLAGALFGSVLWKKRFLYALALMLTPVIASVLALCTWNWWKHDVFATQIFGGYEAIGKVALIIPPDLPGQNHAVAVEIAKNTEPVSSELPSPLGRSRDYYWMTYLGFNGIRRDAVFPALAAAAGAPKASDENLQPIQTRLRINDLAAAIARQTILYRPIAYFENVLIHFVALWTYPTMSDSKEQLHLREMLCSPEIKRFYCQEQPFAPVRVVVPAAVATGKDLLFTGLMLLSLAVPLAFLFRKNDSPQFAAASITSVCINANYAIIALVEVGLPRYSVPMWPLLCVFTTELILLTLPKHWRRGSLTAKSSPI